jgi:hypothetical protein
MKSSLARAPFAPARLAPTQERCNSSMPCSTSSAPCPPQPPPRGLGRPGCGKCRRRKSISRDTECTSVQMTEAVSSLSTHSTTCVGGLAQMAQSPSCGFLIADGVRCN